jgi:hypothetical protein
MRREQKRLWRTVLLSLWGRHRHAASFLQHITHIARFFGQLPQCDPNLQRLILVGGFVCHNDERHARRLI